MRIAYVCADPGVPVFGRKGCSVHVQEVLAAFLRRGAEVELFASRWDGVPLVRHDRLKLHPLPPVGKGDLASREIAARGADAALAGALRQHGPFDLIYQRYSLWSCAAMEAAAHGNTPAILEVNAPLILEQAEHRGLIDRAGAEEITHRAFEAASALIAVSEPLADYLNRQPAAQGRVHVIHNGVDAKRISPHIKPSQQRSSDVVTIGFVGSMKPWHGVSELIEAFALLRRRHHAVRLMLVGDGPQRSAVLEQVDQCGLTGSVLSIGAVDPGEIPAWLTSMDIAVAPYPDLPDFYFSPLKLYEYMAAGLPVVASGIHSLSNMIEHGVTGLLYAPGDAASMTNQLETLSRQPLERQRLGRAARNWVADSHTWDSVAEQILEIATSRGLTVLDCLEAAS